MTGSSDVCIAQTQCANARDMPQGWGGNIAILYTLKYSPVIALYKWFFAPLDMDTYAATAECPQ